MDVHTPEARSKNMSAIKSRNTKPEIKLRKALFKAGLRYRVNYKLTGKPDIVFTGKKVAIFVDGCFWHCCPKCYRQPDNNKEFWTNKIALNIKRDAEVSKALAEDGWTVLRFWEHEVKKEVDRIVKRITAALGEVEKASKVTRYKIDQAENLLIVAEKTEHYD